jgi:hypothetical protein
MALHTNGGCSISKSGDFSGNVITTNCDVHAPGQFDNQGCQITTDNQQTYGDGFNREGGGVYATEWTSDFIAIWHFPRSQIPQDIQSGNPNPSSWGRPLAKFAGACNIDEHFRDHRIIFDITFCGDWAGGVWNQQCSDKQTDCQSFVREQPEAFVESYWLINSIKVYQ